MPLQYSPVLSVQGRAIHGTTNVHNVYCVSLPMGRQETPVCPVC